MAWISDVDFKNISAQADIVDVISHYVHVEKKGKDYVAVCPFHNDTNPSMHISPSKQIYKCFSCGAGGNAFKFVKDIESITYPEAVAKVASFIHYPLNLNISAPKKAANPKNKLYDLLKTFSEYTNYELYSQEGKEALDYLHSRKMKEDLIEKFEIGYAPDSKNILQFFKAKKADENALNRAGLIHLNSDVPRAVFHNRILIPIHDSFGNPVGYTARILPKRDGPKYINSSQSELYDKSRLIFNYHRAKEYCPKANRVVLVEGAMDVLGLEKADIHEGIANLGVACSPAQLELIKRLRVPVYVFYDADRAGQDAVYNFCRQAVGAQIPVRIVVNHSGKDPDEIFIQHGKEELQRTLNNTIPFPEFLFDYLHLKYNLDNYDDKKKYAQEILKYVDLLADSFERGSYYERVRQKTGFDFSRMQTQKPKTKYKKSKDRSSQYLPEPKEGRTSAESTLFSLILKSKQACEVFKNQIGFFKDTKLNKLALYIYDMYRSQDQLDLDALFAQINSEDLREIFLIHKENLEVLPDEWEDLLMDSINKIKDCSLKDRIAQINQEIAALNDPLEKIKLAQEKQSLISQRHQIQINGRKVH